MRFKNKYVYIKVNFINLYNTDSLKIPNISGASVSKGIKTKPALKRERNSPTCFFFFFVKAQGQQNRKVVRKATTALSPHEYTFYDKVVLSK